MLLDKIDNNKDKTITHQELEKAVKEGFFDDENNIRALTQQVKKEESRLLESFRATLTQAYVAIRTKKTITQDDQKIIDLYRKLSPALSKPTPNLYANAPSSKPGSESKEPNINNITYNFDTTCRELTHRAKNAYPQAYNAMIKNMEKKHSNKSAGERQDYIRYESIVRALEAYYKKLDADNSALLKKHGFYSKGTITDAQGKKETVESFGGPDFFACGKLFDYLTTIRYPEYEKDEKLLGSYNRGVEKILKNSGYRGNDKLSEHAKLYKNFEKEAKKSAEKNTYADSLTYLQQHDAPPSDREEDVKIYLAHMQNVFLYTQDYEKLTNKYGPKMLEGYATTMNSLSALDKKHSGFTDAISRMSAYNKKIEDKKKEFGGISNDTLSNYINYTHEAQYLFKKQKALGDVSKRLTDEIQGKTKNASMFPEIKKRLSQEKEKQKRTDTIRDTIKKISPQSYLTLSLLTGAWNGLVDATIGVGTGLGLLVTSLYSDQFATMENAERAQAWTEFLKIGTSSKQLEPLVKDGKANVSVDNVSVVMGSGVVNMLVLLSGAGAIGKGLSSAGVRVGVNIAEKLARRGGLFTRATMQGLPSSFQTYLGAGLDKKTAWSYALNTTLLSSTVEMFAPNDMFFGNPGVMSVIKSLGAKEAAKTLGKEFFKNISKEVGEEIGQETVQMIIEKRIHNHINDKHGTALDSSLTWADFWTTAMVTAMITGVVSGDGSYKMAKNTINKSATVQRICSDQNRYAEYTRKLQQIIVGTNKISGVDYTFASQLLATLESVKQGSVDVGPKEDAQQTAEKKEVNTEPDKMTKKILNNYSISLLNQEVVARARSYAFTDYEILALVMYGGPYFAEINTYLRTGELSNVGKLTEQQIKGITKLLESGLAKLPSISHAEIYRGEAVTKEVFGSLKNKSETGEPYSFGGFTSVTNDKEAARDRYSNWFNDEHKQRVVFVIKPGSPSTIKSLESLDPTYILGDIGENIIGRDVQFFVTKVEETTENGVSYVYLQETDGSDENQAHESIITSNKTAEKTDQQKNNFPEETQSVRKKVAENNLISHPDKDLPNDADQKRRFDLRKMNPDTQKILPQLTHDYPKLEPLFRSMVIREYDSPAVQQHLKDLALLPQNIITQIIDEDIVFFISNETVTSRPWNIELQGEIPRGREETGWTRDNVAGMANELGGVHAGEGQHGSASLILHELGHAIDVKGIVDIQHLRSLYKKIKSEKQLHAYFLQEGDAGLQEFFAETFAEFYKNSKELFIQKYNEEYYIFLQETFDNIGAKEASKNANHEDILNTTHETIKYYDNIPIEKNKYYRVTGMSEINTIQETGKLSISDKTYYDRHILSIIAKHSTYTLEQLEEINQKDTDKIRALYKEFVVPTKTEAGEVTIRARRKSNHGDIGFSKEGLFYNVFDKESGHFGAPVIVGSEDMSLFEKGHHGNKHNVFNKDIESKTPVVLRDGFEASNFEYRLYEEGKGWYKNKFVDQKKNTYEEMPQNNKSSGDTSDSSSKNRFNFSQEVQENGLSKINYIGDVSGEVAQPEVDGKDVATKIQNLHYLAFENKNIFLTTLQSFSEKSGATIEGLDNMIKKTERMEEKVNKEYGGGIDSVKKLGDVLRSTLVFETTTDLNNNFPLLKKLIRENNIDLIRIKNRLGEPTTGDVLINVRFPNGLVAEIKLYTRLMYIAQDIPRVLPPDSKIPLTSYREGMVLDYASLWTDREIQCVQKLKDEGRVKYTLSNDITQPITNHQFYEIWRLLPDIKQNDENSIAFDLLKNKLIAIQQVNGWYSWQLYEKEHGEPYIQ